MSDIVHVVMGYNGSTAMIIKVCDTAEFAEKEVKRLNESMGWNLYVESHPIYKEQK